MWKQVGLYGVGLAAGTLALQWFDYQRMLRAHSGETYVFLIAAAFLALGIFVGTRLMGTPREPAFNGNPQAQAALGHRGVIRRILGRLASNHYFG